MSSLRNMSQIDLDEIFQADNRTEYHYDTMISDTDMLDNESTAAFSPDLNRIAQQADPDFALALHLAREEEAEISRREEADHILAINLSKEINAIDFN